MGTNHSVPEKGLQRRGAAVFSIVNDEPILNTDFSIYTGLAQTRPIMPNIERQPSIPLRKNEVPSEEPPPPPPPRSSSVSRFSDSTIQHVSSLSNNKQPARKSISKKGMYISAFRFIPAGANELSLEEGDRIYVLERLQTGWFYVEKWDTGERGYVPQSYVKPLIVFETWYAGNLSRIAAERRLLQPGLPDGSFLVRENRTRGLLILTVRLNAKKIANYEIYEMPNERKYYMIDDNSIKNTFDSLQSIVDHFRKPINYATIHLPTRLTDPAPPISDTYDVLSKMQIDRKQLEMIAKIDEGEFGIVHKARLGDINVAVKMMKCNYGILEEEHSLKDFLREAELMTRLSHPNLVRLLAVCTRDRPFLIITEYLQNGSLLAYLKQDLKESRLTLASAMNIAAQVACGMSYLAANKCVHRDLAARNVLVGELSPTGIPLVKVCDFGLARQLITSSQYVMSHDTKIAFKWMAPELHEDLKFDSRTDVWSYGVLLWEIGTLGRKIPYPDWSYEYTFKALKSGYRLEKPELVPDFIYQDAMLPCFHENPDKRPTFDQLFNYFDHDINVENIKRSQSAPILS